MKARCTGCSRCGVPRPSSVTTFCWAVSEDSGVTHERTALPSMWTVQAPHCASPHPKRGPCSARDVRTLKDASGNSYGPAIYAAAQKPEGEITEVPSYMFPKPGTLTPTFEKVSFVTEVGDLGCGVGYYK